MNNEFKCTNYTGLFTGPGLLLRHSESLPTTESSLDDLNCKVWSNFTTFLLFEIVRTLQNATDFRPVMQSVFEIALSIVSRLLVK